MAFNEDDGTFSCSTCRISLPVTDIELPQLGSSRNSVYLHDKSKNNISETDEIAETPDNIIADDESMIINTGLLDKKTASKIYKKWSRHGLFTPHKINLAFKKKGLELLYVQGFLYDINGQGFINATTTQFGQTLSKTERITTTDYYSIDRQIVLHYGKLTIFNSDMHIMNTINNYEYSDIKVINNNELPDNIISSISGQVIPFPENIEEIILDSVCSSLDQMTKDYSSSYTEEKDCTFSVRPLGKIYVPVWHFSYGETNRHEIYINAQTGKIYGTPIVSKLKSIITIAIPSIILSTLLCLLIL